MTINVDPSKKSKKQTATRRPPNASDSMEDIPLRLSSANDGRRHARDSRQYRPQAEAKSLPVTVKLFLLGLLIPWIVPFGPLNLPVYRIVLLVALIPCFAMWLRGRAGPIRLPDIGLLLYSAWAAIALAVAHGVGAAVEPSGTFFIDGFGAYLLARCHIRDADDFRNMVRFMTTLIACLVPFALWEWLTGAKPLLVAFGTIFPTVDEAPMVPRMGLWRVQGPFSHSILFGVFCGSMLALVSTVARTDRSRFAHILLVCLVGGITVMSMSSAPIAGIAFQIALLSWEKALRVFRYRWTLLGGLALIGYLVIALGSNQTPVQFYISRFTFDQQTGWYRLAIWNYGSASVANHPIFGIGLGDWARPQWMGSDSVDNFWLLTSMRFGLPGLLLMFLSWAYLWTSIGLRKQLNYTLSVYRTGYLICMVTFVFVGSTVHFWGPTYSWFFFAAGCGAWLLDAKAPQNNPDPQAHPMRGRMSTRPTVGRKALGPVPFTNSDCLN